MNRAPDHLGAATRACTAVAATFVGEAKADSEDVGQGGGEEAEEEGGLREEQGGEEGEILAGKFKQCVFLRDCSGDGVTVTKSSPVTSPVIKSSPVNTLKKPFELIFTVCNW